MFRNKFVAIVIPAHNESRHIAQVIKSAPALADMLIVVDDGSTDATAKTVRRIPDARVYLVQHGKNRGVGAAIVTGYRFALQHRAEVVGVMGGDGQMDTAHLPALLDPVVEGQCDFTKGNRFFSWRSWRGMPLHRAMGNVILSLLTKAASGYWHVFDAQNGYTVISAAMLRRLPLHRLETGYQFENRLLVHLNTHGARVSDVPIPARYGDEESGINPWRDIPAILWTLVTGFWLRVRHKYVRERLSVPGISLLSGTLLLISGGVLALWGLLTKGPLWVSQAASICISLGGILIVSFMAMDFFNGRRLRPWHQPAMKPAEGLTAHSDSQTAPPKATVSAEHD